MRTTRKILPPAAAGAAAAATAAFMAWLFSREGSLGLYRWTEWGPILNAIMMAGALPLLLCLLDLALGRQREKEGEEAPRRGDARLRAGLRGTTAVLGLIVAAGVGALWIGLAAVSRPDPSPVPALRLVSPASGIANAIPGTARLSFSSDPHWGSPKADADARAAILRGVAAARPDAFFILGDNVEMGMIGSQWRAQIEELASVMPELPIRPIMGNHDAIVNGQANYERYFFPDRGASGTGSPYYYSIDAGPATVYVANLLWGAEGFSGRQAAWLESALASRPSGELAIVVAHCFMYSSGYVDEGSGEPWYDHYGTIADIVPVLERGRADLVIAGHNHYMELLERDGVSYAVVGAMGGRPDPAPTYVSPASKWIAQGSYGRLDVEASAEGLRLSFVDRDGKVLREELIRPRP